MSDEGTRQKHKIPYVTLLIIMITDGLVTRWCFSEVEVVVVYHVGQNQISCEKMETFSNDKKAPYKILSISTIIFTRELRRRCCYC